MHTGIPVESPVLSNGHAGFGGAGRGNGSPETATPRPGPTLHLKHGTATVGVQRQYTGTAGRVENAQVAVLLVYASPAGHAVIDRELYVPRSWTRDPERCRAAGIPAQVGFATKPKLATAMITRALDAGVPAAWVTGDEVYGADPKLRACLEARGIGYVLAVACDHPVVAGGDPYRADVLVRRVPARAWQCISAGQGAKGHRYYDWAFVRLDAGDPGQRWLLEHLADPEAVLVVDETGDLKKGARTVGVQRQYTGTAGKIDNAQVAVYSPTPPTLGTA